MGEHRRRADGRRVFGTESKRTAVQRILSDEKTLAELSRELDISPSVIRNWKRFAEAAKNETSIRRGPRATARAPTRCRSHLWAAGHPGRVRLTFGITRSRRRRVHPVVRSLPCEARRPHGFFRRRSHSAQYRGRV
jgi:hypothetical protein